ncbi:MAG: ABC transporter substrate-binding protein [Alicyclobacillus sp.]|nr:ABC transporter substrate-binding protein [Alicyclobacillus sp.]
MQSNKSKMCALAALGMSVVGFAGLSPTAVFAKSQPVTLTFWNGFTGPDRPGYEQLVKNWNKAHPDIQIQMHIEPWDTLLAKLPEALMSGQGPDIIGFDASYIPEYARANLILPVDDLYGSGGLNPKVFPKALVKGLQYNGHYYGAPANFATLMLYYNKTLFKQAGISKPPSNWNQWIADIERLTVTKNGHKQYGIVMGDHATIPNWPILIWGNGGDIVSPDGKKGELTSPKTLAALKLWGELVEKQGVSPTFLTGAESDNLFQSGRAAMEMNGPWMTAGYTQAGLNYDVAPIPAGPAGRVTLADSVTLVLGRSTQHKAQAEAFMKYWNQKSTQEALTLKTGFPPTRTDMMHDPVLKKNPFILKFASVANDARFYLQGIPNYSTVDTDVITPLIQEIEKNPSMTEKYAEAANAKLNSELASN